MEGAMDFGLQAVTLGAAVAVPVWALIELRARSLFVSRREWQESRTEEAEKYAALVVEPLKAVSERMAELAIAQATMAESNRGIRRSLDSLRRDVEQLRTG